MSSSSSSSSDSSKHPKILAQPQLNLKFGEKFQIPGARAPNRHDTESGMSSIDSKPSIKQPPKNSDLRFNPQVTNKTAVNKVPVQRLRSIKYEKKNESSSSSGELSSDSSKSSVKGSVEKKLIPAKPVESKVKVPNPVDIPINDKHLPPIIPEAQPNRPSGNKLKPAQNNLTNSKVSGVKEDKAQAVVKVPVALATGLEGNEKGVKNSELRSAKYVRKDKESSKSSHSDSSESNEQSIESPASRISDDSEVSITVNKHNKKEQSNLMSAEKSSDNDISESSSDSDNETSSVNQEDSLFKISNNSNATPTLILLKPDPENHDGNTGNKEISPEPPQRERIPELLFSVKFLTYSQLFTYVRNFNHQNGPLYDSGNICEKLCKCIYKSDSITPQQCQDLLKLQKLCYQIYDNSDQFHRYLLYSYYSRFCSNGELNFDDSTAKLIGLSSKDEKKNELSKSFSLASILHLIFLIENKPALMRTFSSAKRKEACTFINLCTTLFTESFNLLKRKKISQIFIVEQNAVQAFFEFHSGFVEIWAELSNTNTFTSSVREASSQAVRNPMLCRQVFNK